MASTLVTKLTCVVLLCMVAGAPISQAAITCDQVRVALDPCVNFLTGNGPVSPACCSGIKSLNIAARTTADRRRACNCLISNVGAIAGVNLGLAASLPDQCGVNISFRIDASTNCAIVN